MQGAWALQVFGGGFATRANGALGAHAASGALGDDDFLWLYEARAPKDALPGAPVVEL